MYHTYISTPLIRMDDENRTKNYDFVGYNPSQLRDVDSLRRYKIALITLGGIVGQGNIISTPGDLLLFDQVLYTAKLLKSSTLQEAFIPTLLNNGEYAELGWGNTKAYYGLGWMILCDSTYGKIVFHSGGMAGAVAIFLRNITRGQTLIMLDNVTHRGVHAAGVNLMYLLNNGVIITGKRSLAKVYANTLFKKGLDQAIIRFNEFKTDTAHYFMDERELNVLGLTLLYDGHQVEAVEALKLNTILYPWSWNVYDSYAEALLLAGKKQEAIATYQQSIKLNPGNDGGKRALQKIEGK